MNQLSSRVCNGVLDAIGGTPLVRLNQFLDRPDIELIVKWEAANPGGSAKDRPAAKMLFEALKRGEIGPDTTIVESTSGNMGIGLAQACRYHGLKFICVVDPRAQKQNLSIIEALGGAIELVTQPLNGDFLAARIAKVCELIETTSNSYWPNQYANTDNPRSHFEGTIREIDESLDGEFDVLFVATSSTGTAQGCRDFLKSRGRNVQVVAVDSVGSVLFGGSSGPRKIPGLGAGKEPRLAAGQSFDHLVRVSDLECVVGCRRAAQREAMLIGGSAGGVLMSVGRMQEQFAGKRCVAVLHDSGTRYLETVFSDEWVSESLGCTSEELNYLVGSSSFEFFEGVSA
ncbi:2,3-diaminopropionate biosynthesis protein SbnA [Rhodopirellula sp. P2]|uniref:2,3-diaminopropionate biosynthesis protein SbnA n=1 Tax=Rhodopirellula sp. P2 TaxID=2127060 RepID=UPI002368C8A9|nr:2,3-diaminopropionate biosynthesis protein SbnA [Rhodopirellula sp. P2]WDQ15022.1 2,3-diaminopropionate biosynthesis protein SbnA [Rhodopirellula sp. P2]